MPLFLLKLKYTRISGYLDISFREHILSEQQVEYHVDITGEGISPVELLSEKSGLSKQKIKQAMQKGAVWVTDDKGTHRLRRHSKKLEPATKLHFYFDPVVLNQQVDDAIIVADEGDYSVWYKPRGMLSQGSKWGDHCAINRWVEAHIEPQRPAFIVHRLDRFASGLILLAHKKKTASLLSNMFKNKEIKKEYQVIVHGNFGLEKKKFNSAIDLKPAVTHAQLLQYDEEKNTSLLQVEIETGRKHQIRKHLSAAGFPVLGDRLYGNTSDNADLQLTAYKLSFTSPADAQDKVYLLDELYLPQLRN